MSPETMQTLGLWLIWIAGIGGTLTVLIYATAPFYRSLLGRALMTSSVGFALLVDLALVFHYWDGHDRLKAYIALGVYAVLALGAVLMATAVGVIKWQALRARRVE